MHEDTETTTIQGSLRALRSQWPVIAGVVLVCVLLAVAISVVEHKTYTATATISVTDPNTEIGLVGGLGGSTQTPQQLASVHASQVLRQSVIVAAIADLHTPRSAASIRQAMSVQVDPTSALVDVTATDRSPAFAASLANAIAHEDVAQSVAAARAGYANEARRLAATTKASAANADPGVQAVYVEQLSRLQALSAVASPELVQGLADVPSSPSSPKPVRNAAIAAFLGLLLGIGAATVRSSLDRRLSTAAEIETRLGLPLVGHVRPSGMGQAVGLGTNGGTAYEPADVETFRVLRQNLLFLGDGITPIRSVVVTSALPEEGKTTVAASLAIASAAAGKLTLLVECDLRRPALAPRLGIPATPGLADYLLGTAEPHEVLRVVANPDQPTDGRAPGFAAGGDQAKPLVCIPCGTVPAHPAELLGSERFRSFLSAASEDYDLIVIDSPPLLPVVDARELIPLASAVLLCVRLSQTTDDQMTAAREALGRLPQRATGLVVSDVAPTDSSAGYSYYYAESR
ncbi:MAG TPA: Wzz/FepE/Etk N-terminal domain-containing protein [Solirubrobacteraceae bacterium]|jgi:Mrp family chromosome partitioning ATPase|nr:Wzz/FepE/Etk N-terminal domain-containing protein [Solirubrobacteraceae bacterium]